MSHQSNHRSSLCAVAVVAIAALTSCAVLATGGGSQPVAASSSVIHIHAMNTEALRFDPDGVWVTLFASEIVATEPRAIVGLDGVPLLDPSGAPRIGTLMYARFDQRWLHDAPPEQLGAWAALGIPIDTRPDPS